LSPNQARAGDGQRADRVGRVDHRPRADHLERGWTPPTSRSPGTWL